MNFPRPVRILLYPFSRVFGRCVSLRKSWYARGWLKSKRLDATVVSVGNLTTGGTGKTPMVLWLAEKFLSEGKKVAILSRGYRGSGGTSDEVDLLRHRLGDRVKFGVGSNRYENGHLLQSREKIDVFILDDGFQHLQLARDLDIVMLDGSHKLQNEWLLPAGLLREPIAAVRRADVLIVTRKFERPIVEAGDPHRFCIFYGQTRLLGFRRLGAKEKPPLYLSEIGPGPFLAFCGIGNPDGFFADLDRWHVPAAERKAFLDHHKYSRRDVSHLEREATRIKATGLVTTEKDAQNLASCTFQLPVWVAVIDLVFTAESELIAAIDRILDSRRGAAA
jgi:tetraacyldisaccharide 4'-kinase